MATVGMPAALRQVGLSTTKKWTSMMEVHSLF